MERQLTWDIRLQPATRQSTVGALINSLAQLPIKLKPSEDERHLLFACNDLGIVPELAKLFGDRSVKYAKLHVESQFSSTLPNGTPLTTRTQHTITAQTAAIGELGQAYNSLVACFGHK